MDDEDLAEDLATYFCRITDEFTPLTNFDPPGTYLAPFKPLMLHEVSKKIKEGKKPKSAVEGDIRPCISDKYSDITAIPATRIINYSLLSLSWPAPWTVETQSAIPKTDNVASFDQLRNISCTNMLSKVLESVILDQLREEITIKRDQFGGMPGSGTVHFLIECWDKILRSLDSPEAAAALISIDFSKAFNRMDHRLCVEALAECGASTESLAMVTPPS